MRVISCLLSIAVCFGCTKNETAQVTQPSAAWASQDPSEWPQLVLTNSAEFKDHSPLMGASAFLVTAGNGRVLAATAKHLIGPSGGVEPEISPRELSSQIVNWRLFPRTDEEATISLTGLALPEFGYMTSDWLLLTTDSNTGSSVEYPSTPLTARRTAVNVGETVTLLGCPYSQLDCRQNHYSGTVTARSGQGLFRYSIDPPVDLRGFSGAPIVDSQGLLVGVMTVWFTPKMVDGLYAEAGGEDASRFADLLD